MNEEPITDSPRAVTVRTCANLPNLHMENARQSMRNIAKLAVYVLEHRAEIDITFFLNSSVFWGTLVLGATLPGRQLQTYNLKYMDTKETMERRAYKAKCDKRRESCIQQLKEFTDEPPPMSSKKDTIAVMINRVESVLRERMVVLNVKPGSKRGAAMQAEFLCGAMTASQEKPVRWVMCIVSGRSVLSLPPLDESPKEVAA